MRKITTVVVFAASLMVLDVGFCGADEGLLKTLADKMEDRIAHLDGTATYREFDVKEATVTYVGSHSYATTGDTSVLKVFDNLGALRELRLVNPDYVARVTVAKTGEMTLRGKAISAIAQTDKYHQLKRSYGSQHPSWLHCRFGASWLPNDFRAASIVDGPYSTTAGTCLLIRGPGRDYRDNTAFDESTWNIVVDNEEMRLVSVHYVENKKYEFWRGDDPMRYFPFYSPTTTSIRYENWVKIGESEYPTLLVHGKVDAGDPNIVSDDEIETSGYTHIQFDPDAKLTRDEAFLTFYGIPEPR
jgi:hypothetical protein